MITGQVPYYTIVGNGCLASHMRYYFDALAIPYDHWHRQKNVQLLEQALSKSTHALVLITDAQIDAFIERFILRHAHVVILHCSGALSLDTAYSVHPLQTFPVKAPYDLETYQRMPFIIEDQGPPFSYLLPGVDNPHYRIKKEEKPFYHAMCVLANNISTLLWEKCYREMSHRFGVMPDHLIPFLEQTFSQIKTTQGHAQSGPFVRGDQETLMRNLKALQGDEFHDVFEAVMNQKIRRKV